MSPLWKMLGRYAIAVGLTLLAAWLRVLLVPVLGLGTMYITVFPTIIAVAVLAGFGPGIVASVVGILTVESWLLPPPGIVLDAAAIVRIAIIFGSALFLGSFSQRLRDARNQARRREFELEESNARYRSLGDAVFDGLVIHDRGVILETNQAFCEMAGYAREELVGRQSLDFLIAPESKASVSRHIQQGLTDIYESVFLKKNGLRFVAEVRGRAVIYGGRPARVSTIHNIEERKNYENRLRQSRDRLRVALESAEMGTWEMNPAAGEVRWDSRTQRLFGASEHGRIPYTRLLEYVHEADRAGLDRAVRAALAPDSIGEYERPYRTCWPDGSIHWVLATGQAYFEGEGRDRHAVNFSGVVQDITERKQAEDELFRQRELLTSIIENIPVMITIYDPGLNQFRFNRELKQVLGWSEADAGDLVLKVYPDPRYREEVTTFMKAAVPGEWREFAMRAKDGSRVESAWSNVRLTNDVQVGIGIDLRARRRAERSLQKLYESGIVGVIYWNMDGQITDANDRFLAIVGYTREDLREGRLDWGRMTPPEFQALDENSIRELKTKGANAAPFEKEYLRKDGSRVPVLIGGAMLDAARHDGIAVVVDISDRKAAEEALRDADRRKDEFLAMLAHELRNPLAPIRNAVHLLRLLGPQDGPLIKQRDMIERQVSHMARLLDDLLDVSRITRGMITLNKRPVAVDEVLTRAVESARPLINSRRHELEVELPPAELLVNGDMDRLVQVVNNLLTNAAKYTPEGGKILVAGSRENDQAVIRVRDNGAGIEPGMLRSIFGLFTQVRSTLDRSQGGLGLGLTIVRRLVEMHGGRVAASSPGLGKGSEFTVWLPLAAPAAAPETPRQPQASAAAAGRHHRVLVVEDVVDAADSLTELLRSWGHQARAVYNGAEALEDYRKYQPDVVLLDIGLPGLNGYELARRLRGLSASLLIMAMSGYGQESDRRQAAAAGIQRYMVKPVDLEQLRGLLAGA